MFLGGDIEDVEFKINLASFRWTADENARHRRGTNRQRPSTSARSITDLGVYLQSRNSRIPKTEMFLKPKLETCDDYTLRQSAVSAFGRSNVQEFDI